ncbi:hypothetical protein HK096_006786, partial [Nowakowskiella sp. JEL0078]
MHWLCQHKKPDNLDPQCGLFIAFDSLVNIIPALFVLTPIVLCCGIWSVYKHKQRRKRRLLAEQLRNSTSNAKNESPFNFALPTVAVTPSKVSIGPTLVTSDG